MITEKQMEALAALIGLVHYINKYKTDYKADIHFPNQGLEFDVVYRETYQTCINIQFGYIPNSDNIRDILNFVQSELGLRNEGGAA